MKVKFNVLNISFKNIYNCNSWCGENRTKTDITLACKTVFSRFSTSGERPRPLCFLTVSATYVPPYLNGYLKTGKKIFREQ